MHIVLEAAEGGVRATRLDDSDEVRFLEEFQRGRLPSWLAEWETDAARWVWDDTARWYPDLLEAGVRVERCIDLRLCHAVLRRALATAATPLAIAEPNGWDRLEAQRPDDGGLFRMGDDGAELDAVAEFRLQRQAISQASGGRLPLLLAAESAGALIAAELTFAGVPWRADVHDRMLTGLLGPRPAAGMRPPRLAELLDRMRELFDVPDLNPDSPPELLRGLRRAGITVSTTRSWELKRIDHPGMAALLEYKKLSRLASANGWQWLDSWVRDGRFSPVYVPGGV
ncbi:MAG: bifunctional 3'-5' exonuclease/DNA polymerase, partial [Actinomycetota bacterium]|nr:bifunctional 3'-5' exonuclease/DNA polymerase [Actinomycetota bacterium]